MKISGKITRFNQVKGRMPGIQIEGAWYNATAKTEKFVKEDMVGSTVEIDEVDGKISFIKVLEKGETPQSHTDNQSVDRESRIVRMNVLNRAVDMANAGIINKEEILDYAVKFETWVG
jgi:ATP adenylyltransferase/5',5'''-P-1,P-4-tetraphosphate phosphorylase II